MSRIFVAIVLAIMVLPGVIQTVIEIRGHEVVYALNVFRTMPTAPKLRAYEKELASRLFLSKRTTPPYSALLDRIFRRGNSRVVFGRDDWLFLADSFDYVAGRPVAPVAPSDEAAAASTTRSPVDAILAYQRQLTAMGIDLAVVVVPEKLTIYPEKVDAALPPASAPNNDGLVSALVSLEHAGVEVIELTEPFLEAKKQGLPIYMARDTHWSPVGVDLAAQFIAGRLCELGWAKNGGASFLHRRVRLEEDGDIYGMLSYAGSGALFSPMSFDIEQIVARPHGPRPTGDRASPILVLGDSYTGIYNDLSLHMGQRAGLAEHLADRLGIPLDVVAIPGGGVNRSREALALRPEGLKGKHLVIWEFGERELLPGVEWNDIAPPPAVPELAADVHGGPRKVRARLVDASRLRADRGVYLECVVMLKYEVLEGDAPSGQPIFVAAWGRKGWKLTPANDYPIGVVQDLSLVPVGDRIDLERTCWVDNVGVKGPSYWADSVAEVRAP